MQNPPPREMSPSPAMRDRSRTIKAQSMPVVPSVIGLYTNQNQPRQGQQPSPTTSSSSHQSRRSPPPPASQVSGPASKLSSPSHTYPNARDHSPEHMTPPPTRAHSQSNVHQAISQPPHHQHSHGQPNVHAHTQIGYPRPLNRVPPPQFLTSFNTMGENWEELMAEIERADMQQTRALAQQLPNPAGTSGVAYAGGAASAGVVVAERARANDRTSPSSGGSTRRRQTRTDRDQQNATESPVNRDRQPQAQMVAPSFQSQPNPSNHTPEPRDSPYHAPVGTPGEYPSYKRDSYPSHPRIPTPPMLRRASNATNPEYLSTPTTPPATAKVSNRSPPLQAIHTRTPDRSLPVQEEPEEDVTVAARKDSRDRDREQWTNNAHADHIHEEQDLHEHEREHSPVPSSDVHPEGNLKRYESGRGGSGRDSRAGHRDDDDETLIEHDSDERRPHSREVDEEEGYTPRSPLVTLPEGQPRFFAPETVRQPTRPKNRSGTTDQLGLRGIDATTFEQNATIPKSGSLTARSNDIDQQRRQLQQQPMQQHRYNGGHASEPHPPGYTQSQSQSQSRLSQLDELQSFFDDPASAYIHHYLQSPRPNAPIPPTPHSQTAAPSPSPLISGMQSEAGLPPFSPVQPVGSPYPFPFSHVRRSNPYSGPQHRQGPSSNYDPNHPSVIQEQLALQWQMYAVNNNRAPMSESTFSPSTTPFQGAGYNPWAFLHTTRALGGRQPDRTTSLQSSPSHEPIQLPLPPVRGRGLKRRDRSTNLRPQPADRKAPPRVESTQPRETSPEPSSSGEETAGEERYEVPEEGNWVNGIVRDDSGDWIDEEDEGDEEDLLELEYHPSYVSNVEKRRRRWETRWESLVQAVS